MRAITAAIHAPRSNNQYLILKQKAGLLLLKNNQMFRRKINHSLKKHEEYFLDYKCVIV